MEKEILSSPSLHSGKRSSTPVFYVSASAFHKCIIQTTHFQGPTNLLGSHHILRELLGFSILDTLCDHSILSSASCLVTDTRKQRDTVETLQALVSSLGSFTHSWRVTLGRLLNYSELCLFVCLPKEI